MKTSSSIPWIDQEFENSVFDFERITNVSSKSRLQLVVI